MKALDERESELNERASAFAHLKESLINVFKQIPSMKNTLVEYVKRAKEERERKEREEKAKQIAEYTDNEVVNVTEALEKEDFEKVEEHAENLEKVKVTTDEIGESKFEINAEDLSVDFIDESQFEIADPKQKTLSL